MDAGIYTKLANTLKAEAEYITKNETDKKAKMTKLNTLLNLAKILDNYDELEPTLQKFFYEKAQKEKWER